MKVCMNHIKKDMGEFVTNLMRQCTINIFLNKQYVFKYCFFEHFMLQHHQIIYIYLNLIFNLYKNRRISTMVINGLVLGGGGSRGAFQIGAVMALHELGFKYQVITGTSVGAINAFLLGINKLDLLKNIWSNIDFDKIFKHKYKRKNKTLETFFASLIKGGLAIEPLEKLVKEHADIDALKKSSMKTGIVCTGPFRKYTPLQIKELPNDMIHDYLIASCSAAPFIKKKNINKKKYYDGGYSDNLPVKLAVDMGATKIIAINISIGAREKVDAKSIDYLCIKPSSKLPSVMNFSNTAIKEMIQKGYNDVMVQRAKIIEFICR